jgi:hypothetical protein
VCDGVDTFIVAVGDFNGDSYPDVVVLLDEQKESSSLGLHLNQGDGTFGAETNLVLGPYAVSRGSGRIHTLPGVSTGTARTSTICLWFDTDPHEPARFYAATFPNSEVTAVYKAPGDFPGGKEGATSREPESSHVNGHRPRGK